MKLCYKCKFVLPHSEFHRSKPTKDGLNKCCKECKKKSYLEKKEHYSLYKKEWYLKNRETILIKRDLYKSQNSEKIKSAIENWRRSDNPKALNDRMRRKLRHRLRMAFKGGFRSGSAIKDLGCSIDELKKHLENQFKPGMTWSNYGKWHIDHIKPLSKFDLTNREQLLKAIHYTNLQLLWTEENLKKGTKSNAA